MNPFPHGQNMAQALASSSSKGGSQRPPASTSNTSIANVYMVKGDTHTKTKTQDYGMSNSTEKGKEATNPPVPLHIEKTMGETMRHISKWSFKKDYHNMNARVSHNYSIVEDLAQTPCVMSALEVLQSYPSQRKALLSTLRSINTCNPGAILLNPTDLKRHLPYHVVFQIVVSHTTKYFTWNTFVQWLTRVPRLA
jgi:hypothetical protein